MWIDLNSPSLLQTVITAQMQHCLCCKLYCFLFLEFLEIQRWNAVQSFSQPDFQCCHEQLMICITVWSRIHATIHHACFASLHNWDVVCQISGVVWTRANSCSKQKSSSCSLASFVSSKPYSPTADDIADSSLLPTSTPPTSRPLRCKQYVRNPIAAFSTHTLIKLLIWSNWLEKLL